VPPGSKALCAGPSSQSTKIRKSLWIFNPLSFLAKRLLSFWAKRTNLLD
jgi:hypothetical protein